MLWGELPIHHALDTEGHRLHCCHSPTFARLVSNLDPTYRRIHSQKEKRNYRHGAQEEPREKPTPRKKKTTTTQGRFPHHHFHIVDILCHFLKARTRRPLKQQQFPPWHTARTLGLPPKKRKNKRSWGASLDSLTTTSTLLTSFHFSRDPGPRELAPQHISNKHFSQPGEGRGREGREVSSPKNNKLRARLDFITNPAVASVVAPFFFYSSAWAPRIPTEPRLKPRHTTSTTPPPAPTPDTPYPRTPPILSSSDSDSTQVVVIHVSGLRVAHTAASGRDHRLHHHALDAGSERHGAMVR